MPTDNQGKPAVAGNQPDSGADVAAAGRGYGTTLWEPSPQVIANAKITAYADWLATEYGLGLLGYEALWQWSVDDPGRFWATIWDYFGVIGTRGGGRELSDGSMPDVRWFTGARLNYARDARRAAQADPGRTAVLYRSEGGRSGALSCGELDREVARIRAALRALGVVQGDRVAGYLPNTPEALIALLATASLGAIWSSCSPDFGVHSVIDRFAQIEPKVLIAVDGYVYGGKSFDRRGEVAGIAAALPSLESVIMIDYLAVAGQPLVGTVGELVITRPMPSMPVGFWHDPGGQRYTASYFADYPGVCRHGDWIMMLPDGGSIIYGRSDATLNRGGVRMGTSEFYRVVEGLPEVADSLVIDTGRLGQEGRLILYVVLADGRELDQSLDAAIRAQLRAQLTPRHVPDEIHQVPGIPKTLSGKKLEVPVRKFLLGTPAADAADPDALANPEVLTFFAVDGQS